MAILVTPLAGKVVLLAAQCLTPAVICFSPLPDRVSMSLGDERAVVESTPYCANGRVRYNVYANFMNHSILRLELQSRIHLTCKVHSGLVSDCDSITLG